MSTRSFTPPTTNPAPVTTTPITTQRFQDNNGRGRNTDFGSQLGNPRPSIINTRDSTSSNTATNVVSRPSMPTVTNSQPTTRGRDNSDTTSNTNRGPNQPAVVVNPVNNPVNQGTDRNTGRRSDALPTPDTTTTAPDSRNQQGVVNPITSGITNRDQRDITTTGRGTINRDQRDTATTGNTNPATTNSRNQPVSNRGGDAPRQGSRNTQPAALDDNSGFKRGDNFNPSRAVKDVSNDGKFVGDVKNVPTRRTETPYTRQLDNYLSGKEYSRAGQYSTNLFKQGRNDEVYDALSSRWRTNDGRRDVAELLVDSCLRDRRSTTSFLARSSALAIARGDYYNFASCTAEAFGVARRRGGLRDFAYAIADAIVESGSTGYYSYGQALATAYASADGGAAIAEATAEVFCYGNSYAEAWSQAYSVAITINRNGCVILSQAYAIAEASCGGGYFSSSAQSEATSQVFGYCGIRRGYGNGYSQNRFLGK